MNNKKPTPPELERVALEYTSAVNHLQELGLIEVISHKGVRLNPKLQIEIIGEIPPEPEDEETL